jgi:glycosyltransferase involved in cell wall biosynthesis
VDLYDANSRAALDLLAGLGIDPARLVHIPNGLDLSEWPARDPERGLGAEVPLIVCAARFVPLKRHGDLITALGELRRDARSFRAVLAGEGPMLEETRALVRRMGLDECVELPGSIGTEEMRGVIGAAAVACLPSASEGMPGALMEAMARGVPVVGTDVGGTRELIVDGESGLLVPAYDPSALAAALARLLDDPALSARIGAGGRRRMEECFSIDVMVAAKQRLFHDLAGRR